MRTLLRLVVMGVGMLTLAVALPCEAQQPTCEDERTAALQMLIQVKNTARERAEADIALLLQRVRALEAEVAALRARGGR